MMRKGFPVTDLRDIVNEATPAPWEARTVHHRSSHPADRHVVVGWTEDGRFEVCMWATVDDARFIATFDPTLVSALLDLRDAAEQVLLAHDRAMDPDADMDWTGPTVDVLLRDAFDRLDALEDNHA